MKNDGELILFDRLKIPSTDSVTLSAKLWHSPPNSHSLSRPIVVFVHPLGKLGGSSNNMLGLAKKFSAGGFDCITFDLRGVGGSNGYSTWMCKSESSDLQSVLRYVESNYSQDIFLFGSSAGATVVGANLDYSSKIIGAAFVGYVWGYLPSFLFGWAHEPLERSIKPKIFIVGDNDEFTSISQYRSRMRKLSGSVNEMKLIEGKNHFEIESPDYDEQNFKWVSEFIEKYFYSHNNTEH